MKFCNLTAILLSVVFVVSCKEDEELNTFGQWSMPNVLITNEVTEIGYSTATVSVAINGFEKAQIENDVECRYFIGELYESQYGNRTVKYYEDLFIEGDPFIKMRSKTFDVSSLAAHVSGLKINSDYCFIPFLYHKQEQKYIIGKPTTFKTLDYQPTLKITNATMIDDCHMRLTGKCECDISEDELGYDLGFEIFYHRNGTDFYERKKYIRSKTPEFTDTLWVDVYNGEKLFLKVYVNIVEGDHSIDQKVVTETVVIERSITVDWRYIEAVQESNDTHVVFWSSALALGDLSVMGGDRIRLCYFMSRGKTLENFESYSTYCPSEFVDGQMRYEGNFVRGENIVYCPGYRYYNERTKKWLDCYGEKQYYKTNEFASVAPAASKAVDLGLSVKWAPYCIGQMTYLETPTVVHIGSIDMKDWDNLWRMPTVEEVKELFENCVINYSYDKGCYVFTSKINGQTLDMCMVSFPSSGFWTSDEVESADYLYYYKYSRSDDGSVVPVFDSGYRYSSTQCAICPVLK